MTEHGAALLAELATCEHRVWQALVAGDPAADHASLSADFLGVYPSGFAGRADHVRQLDGGPTVETYEMSDLRLMNLGQDHVLLAYRADFVRPGAVGLEAMLVSSVWRRSEGGWINVFSQDTPVAG